MCVLRGWRWKFSMWCIPAQGWPCHNSPQQEGRILRHNPQCPSQHWERQQNNLRCFISVRLKDATDGQGFNPDWYQVNAELKWGLLCRCKMHWCKYTKHTHTGIVSHSSAFGTQIGAFLSQFHGKGPPLLKDSCPQSLDWHRWCLFIDQNGLSNSIFCLSNWVAGWHCSSNVITLYKSYLFGVGFLMG